MTIYFTSDTHLYHKNILAFTDRPYSDVETMTEDLIACWNEQVSPTDTVYHLGDLCLGNFEQTVSVLQRLNGQIVLIKGNHDYSKHYKRINKLGLLHAYHEVGTTLKYEKHQLWLTHYPLEIGLRPRMWSIHGHLHDEASKDLNQINVGIDSPHWMHKPFGEFITLDELYEELEQRLPLIEEAYLNK